MFRKNFNITKDGKPTAGNPFASNTKFKPEISAYGLRNPQGMALDEKGQLWDAEMGSKGGDEINLIQPGKNYGWGDVSYGNEYGAKQEIETVINTLNNRPRKRFGYKTPNEIFAQKLNELDDVAFMG